MKHNESKWRRNRILNRLTKLNQEVYPREKMMRRWSWLL